MQGALNFALALLGLVISGFASACESEPAPTPADCSDSRFPKFEMVAARGKQLGAIGTFGTGKIGCGSYSIFDSVLFEPAEFTRVRPGEQVRFTDPNGKLVANEHSDPASPPMLRVRRLGCYYKDLRNEALLDRKSWIVDLGPGTYSAWLESSFVDRDGWYGEASVGFGLIVTTDLDAMVAPDLNADAGCGEADSGMREQ